jgi:phosphate-selective porin OprO/OprP
MQGRIQNWLAGGLAALLFVAAPANSGEVQRPNSLPDPGYSDQWGSGQLVSNNAATMNFEARITALEAVLADEKKEEIQWKDVSGEKWTVKLGGRILGDYVMFAHQDAANLAAIGDQQNYFEIRSLRIQAEGTGYGVYDYKLQLDFEPENEEEAIKDLWIGIHEIPVIGYARFGHFKAPMSLEQLTSSRYITFMERSLADVFVPGRKVGAASYNNALDEAIHVSYGVFFNDIEDNDKQRIDDAQGVEFALRGVWTPVYTANGRGLIHVGGAWRYVDDRDDNVSFNARPETHEEDYFLQTGAIDARDFHVFNTEMAAIYGPLSLQSELFLTRVNPIGGGEVDLYGAYAYASYFLTGESRGYKRKEAAFDRVKPNTNFWIVRTSDGPSAGWGAWELAARWSYLDFTDPALDDDGNGTLHDLTLGINWYWNPYARMMFNYIHPFGNRDDVGANEADILGMRMQVDF